MGKNLKICALILSAIMLLSMLAGCVVANNAEADTGKDPRYADKLDANYVEDIFVAEFPGFRFYDRENIQKLIDAVDNRYTFKEIESVDLGTRFPVKIILPGEEFPEDEEPAHFTFSLIVAWCNVEGERRSTSYTICDGVIFKSFDDKLFESTDFEGTRESILELIEELIGEPIRRN